MNKIKIPWVKVTTLDWNDSADAYLLTADLSIYSLDAVLKTCYLFLDRCYIFVEPDESEPNQVRIYLTPQSPLDDLEQVLGEFSNRLIWQAVRQKVAEETQPIREMIVRQAFTEAGLTD